MGRFCFHGLESSPLNAVLYSPSNSRSAVCSVARPLSQSLTPNIAVSPKISSSVPLTARVPESREEFRSAIALPGNQTRAAIIEEVAPRIPLGTNENGSNYRIFLGLALSEDELEYNRNNR